MLSKFLVYALVDPRTKEIRYVGKSCSGLDRPSQHVWPSMLNRKSKKSSWIKSILNQELRPEIKILMECNSPEEAAKAEVKWIEILKRIGARLTNMTDGGIGGATSKGLKRQKPIIAVNLETEERKYYKSGGEAAKEGFSRTKIAAVCNGRRKSHRGYFFYFASNPGQEPKKSGRKTPIEVINKLTGETFLFSSIAEAAEKLYISRNTISDNLHGRAQNKRFIFLKTKSK